MHPTGAGGCYTTIQAAVTAAAAAGDTINIAAGTYAEHVIVGAKQLTFIGAGADSTFVDGSNTGRVFSVTATSATFADLTVQNGKVTSDSGGGIYAAGALTLTNVNVLSNTATDGDGGGGVRVRGELRVTGGRFENNLVTGTIGGREGGAIRSNAATAPHPNVTISGATFISNTAAYGGAVSLAASVWLTDTQFISNSVTSRGGGVFSSGGGTLTLSGGRFERNAAGPGLSPRGGGLYFAGAAMVEGTEFISNTVSGTGGGARIDGAVTLTNATFTGNRSTTGQGGGLYANAALTVTNGTFTDNSTTGSLGGGGLYVASGLTVSGAQFIGNRAEGVSGSGAGLYAVNNASARTVVDTDFISNTADQYGGGLYTGGGPLTLTNSRFISNTSFLVGGGARFGGATTVVDSQVTSNHTISSTGGSGGGLYFNTIATVTGTAFTGNTSGYSGGGLYASSALTLTNSTFYGNTSAAVSGVTPGGGGLYAGNVVTVTSSQFAGNSAAAGGGGAYFSGAATLVDAAFADNTATDYGGGLYARASLVMTDTQLIRNSAANGGGIYVSGNTAGASRMVNVLLAANTALTDGAALYLYSAGIGATARTATIVHGTIASPTVGASQAIFVGKPSAYTPEVNITNTIIASYTTGISVTAGALVGSDYNYFNNAPTAIDIGSHSISGAEHHLLFVDAAADNYRPALGSPAPTHGINLGVAADLDGATRSDPPTIGAYEGTPYPNVWLSKVVTPTSQVPYHGVVTYTLDLNNTGSLTDTVRLTDTLPAGVTFGEWVSAPEEGVIRDGNVITWTGVITDLAAATTLVFTATHTGNYGDVIANTAWFSGSAQTGSAAASFSVEACTNPLAVEVQNTGDSGPDSLRQALVDVCPGGTITFAPALTASGAATITLASGELAVTKNVTITGPGANLLAVSGNHAARVFYVNSGVGATLSGLTIRDGNSSGDGGGIYNDGALTLASSIVLSNTASNFGGGILVTADGSLTVTTSTVYSNSAGFGGGISSSNALTVSNSTISANSAKFSGGGISNSNALTVSNSTIAGNAAKFSGGGIYNSGTLHYRNTIIASSSGGDCYNDAGTIATNVANLVADGSCSAALSGDPLLGPLQDNSGATWTHALLPSSPAIDAGDSASCPANDQRGQARADYRCDIGAYELKLGDSASVAKTITGPGTYTFGPTLVKIEIAAGNLGALSATASGSALAKIDRVAGALGTLSAITITHTAGDHPGRTGTDSTRGVGWGEYWTVTPNNDASGFTVSLTLPTLFTPDANSRVCRFISGIVWDCALTSSSTTPFNAITRDGVTTFSDWAAGSQVQPNRIRLAMFDARGDAWSTLRGLLERLFGR